MKYSFSHLKQIGTRTNNPGGALKVMTIGVSCQYHCPCCWQQILHPSLLVATLCIIAMKILTTYIGINGFCVVPDQSMSNTCMLMSVLCFFLIPGILIIWINMMITDGLLPIWYQAIYSKVNIMVADGLVLWHQAICNHHVDLLWSVSNLFISGVCQFNAHQHIQSI